jgi:hypothetical protein
MELKVFLYKFRNLSKFIEKEANRIFQDFEDVMIQENIERLYLTGQDTEGKIIGYYKPESAARRLKSGKLGPGDKHWVSMWAGYFFKGIEIKEIKEGKYQITSDFKGFPKMEELNPGYLGLNQKEAEEMSEEIAGRLTESIVKYFN